MSPEHAEGPKKVKDVRSSVIIAWLAVPQRKELSTVNDHVESAPLFTMLQEEQKGRKALVIIGVVITTESTGCLS